MKVFGDLTLHDPDARIVVNKEHLEAINYLLESNIRHETTAIEEHNNHIDNARDVIKRALRFDMPNKPINPMWGKLGDKRFSAKNQQKTKV